VVQVDPGVLHDLVDPIGARRAPRDKTVQPQAMTLVQLLEGVLAIPSRRPGNER
jgi:hypothetical protein